MLEPAFSAAASPRGEFGMNDSAPDSFMSRSNTTVVDRLRGGVWTANGDAGSISYADIDKQLVVREIVRETQREGASA